jgi:homoserine O-succinyltransferase
VTHLATQTARDTLATPDVERAGQSVRLPAAAAPREAFFARLAATSGRPSAPVEPVHIALVNNMPDMALSRTELQFMDLLQAATDGVPVRLSLYSLPAVPRGERGRQHLAASYRPIDDLWQNPPHAIVVSGTEPIHADLRDECYWSSLTGLIDWIDETGVPALFSCLAAHAAVLHCDGIARAPLDAKCFGLFDHEIVAGDPLTDGLPARSWLPHTRWNRVDEQALLHHGYRILSRSESAGVGLFARQRRGLWLFCQAHPEYDGPSLAREYKRDVQRYLRGERADYPDVPHAYFATREIERLAAFRTRALAGKDEEAMAQFPAELAPGPYWDAWRPAAVRMTQNWLHAAAAAPFHTHAG